MVISGTYFNMTEDYKNKELLTRLYVDERKSTYEIAELYGCSRSTISRWLTKHRIQLRDASSSHLNDDVHLQLKDKDLLHRLYVIERKSTTEISDILGCFHGTVGVWLNNHNIPLRDASESKLNNIDAYEKLQDRELLHKLYIIERKTIAEISDLFGCSHDAIKGRLNNYEISIRNISEAKLSDEDVYTKLQDKELLNKLYNIELKSIYDIADLLGCSVTTICRRLDDCNINRRNISESKLNNIDAYEKLKDKELLHRLYIDERKTTNEIAELFRCSETSVYTWLTKHCISIRNISECQLENINAYEKLQDKELLHRLYVGERKTTTEIAELFECNHNTISTWLYKHDISIRNPSDARLNEDIYKKIQDKELLNRLYVDENKTIYEIADIVGCGNGTVGRYLKLHNIPINKSYNTSKQEREILNFITSLGLECYSTREIISPYELDIYIPSKNLAIEFNGLFWHSNIYKPNDYHKTKTDLCEQQGIQLIHIFEDEWKYRRPQVKSLLLSKLGMNTSKIFARKCKIVTGKFSHFFNSHHIQGDTSNTITYALNHNDTLVAAMAFKIRSEGVYELVRYATSIQVVGGASKLLKAFISNHHDCKEIISFADRTISNGNMYHKLGFTLDSTIRHDYKYIIDDKRVHKFNYRIDRFKNDDTLLYEEGMTENQLAELNNIPKIYDCGKLRFILKL